MNGFSRGTGSRVLVVNRKDLPIRLHVVDDRGGEKWYLLAPAGKGKLGACLQAISPAMKRLLGRK